MKVDASITPSRWQYYASWSGVLVLLVMMGCSELPWLWLMLLAAVLLLWQWFTLSMARQRPQLALLWQGEGRVWYWRFQGDKRTYRGHLLSLRSYGVLFYVVLQTGTKTQRVVLWRDQLSLTQWRYLMIHATLKQ